MSGALLWVRGATGRMGCELKVVYWLQMGEGKLGGGVVYLV